MLTLESTTKNPKSSSWGTALTRCARIAPSPLALELLTHFGKYLGFPIFHKRPVNVDFQFIFDNMKKRLSGWKTKFLNLTSRTILTKATLSSIPSHVMQYIKLPAKITNTINKVQRDFVWGTIAEKRKFTYWAGIASQTRKPWEDLDSRKVNWKTGLSFLA